MRLSCTRLSGVRGRARVVNSPNLRSVTNSKETGVDLDLHLQSRLIELYIYNTYN